MALGLFAILFLALPSSAFAQQQSPPTSQQPIPDTRTARERHRVQEKEPPLPEGPWGAEEFGFTWRNPVWRGLIVTAGPYGGASLNSSLPKGLGVFSDGVNPPVFESLEWKDQSFRTTSVTLAADLDMIRLSVSLFRGDFDADAVLTWDNGVTQASNPVEIEGAAYGFRVGVYWPTLRYRSELLEVSVGPIATVGWLHEETHDIPGATLFSSDAVDVLTGSLGPMGSLRLMVSNVEFELNAECSFMTGSVRGWTKALTVGIGIHF